MLTSRLDVHPRSLWRIGIGTVTLAAGLTATGLVGSAAEALDGSLTVKPGRSVTLNLGGTGERSLATFTTPALSGGPLVEALALRGSDSTRTYRAQVLVDDQRRTLTASVGRVVGGVQTTLGTTPIPGTVPVGGSLTLEAYTTGDSTVAVGLRAWVTGQPKPGFQLVVNDSDRNRVIAAGSPRARATLSTAATKSVTVKVTSFTSVALGSVPTVSLPAISPVPATPPPSPATPPASPATRPTANDPFAPTSPWRQTIPTDALLHPSSASMVAGVTGSGKVYANLFEFGIPIFSASSGTPTYGVGCTVTWWGPCPFAGVQTPIPDGSRPHTGSDGAMVVVDETTRKVFEFWQAARTGTGWQTSFGAINDLDGSGWGGAGTGSGASRLGGVIRVDEIKNGVIPHALAMQSANVCKDWFVPPAAKTDGESTRADCLPEGTRLRLDPTFNVETASSLSAGQRAVVRALQTYGAVVMDKGSAPLSLSFEAERDATSNTLGAVYSGAGFRWDYDGLETIPWNRLQVLR